MSYAAHGAQSRTGVKPASLLSHSATSWFVVAAAGHFAFLVYIVGFYWLLIAGGGTAALADTHLPNGFVDGDSLGNAAVLAHVLLAAIVIGGGPLQLVPAVRERFPAFHRWLGRSYVTAAVISSLAGLYMVWARGTVGGPISEISITLDGVLILVFAAVAVRYAVARDVVRHRRWAMRLFLVASGVWFFRIGLMGWVVMTGGIGIDWETFSGPFITFWGFGQYLLPLVVLELYFRAERSTDGRLKLATSVVLFLCTVVTSIGIFAATTGLWLPRIT